jgi:hypothetical protein
MRLTDWQVEEKLNRGRKSRAKKRCCHEQSVKN